MARLTKKEVKEAQGILARLDQKIVEHLEVSTKMLARYVHESDSRFQERVHGAIIGYIEALETVGLVSCHERLALIHYFIQRGLQGV